MVVAGPSVAELTTGMTNDTTTRCATHPDVETELRCSRCETPICPRCLVQTPVGSRCRRCANLRRPPMYEMGPGGYLRAFGAALVFGVLIGLAWALLLPAVGRFFGFFVFFLAIGLGYLAGEVIERATNRKRGPVVQGAAVSGLVLAYLVRNLVIGAAIVPANDLFGYIVVGIASLVAIGKLR
jgi:hypothetical protein